MEDSLAAHDIMAVAALMQAAGATVTDLVDSLLGMANQQIFWPPQLHNSSSGAVCNLTTGDNPAQTRLKDIRRYYDSY